MAKGMYVGVITPIYGTETAEIDIIGSNIGNYFSIEHGSTSSTSQFRDDDNTGIFSITPNTFKFTASIKLTALYDMHVRFDYRYLMNASNTKFSITIAGNTIVDRENGAVTGRGLGGQLSQGDVITFVWENPYTFSSTSANDIGYFNNMVVTTEIKSSTPSGEAPIARKVISQYTEVGGVARGVKSGYVGVNGIARRYWGGAGKSAGSYAVGESVFLGLNGVNTEFIVVHQGNPDSTKYDSSFDGTWLLMKDLYYTGESYNFKDPGSRPDIAIIESLNYADDTIFNSLDKNVFVKDVVLPAFSSSGSVRVFSLSAAEVGLEPYTSVQKSDGSCLDYFKNRTDSTRIAYYDGKKYAWILRTYGRTESSNESRYIWFISPDGSRATKVSSIGAGMMGFVDSVVQLLRPAMVIESDTAFDPETNILLDIWSN
jgi:hypothetical protein